MADALASPSPSFAPQKAIELAQKALAANKELQHELTARVDQLELEVSEADRLLEALENGADIEDAEDEIHIPGARRALSLFPLSECLNTESPLYTESKKRVDFLARITPQSFNAKQLDALKAAVHAENQRLRAYRKQAGGDPASIDLDRNVEGIDWDIVAEKVSDTSSDTFTADQCRIKWLGSQHPDFNHSEWKATETNKLFEVLRATQNEPGGHVDWVSVTHSLGTNRTVVDVAARGQPRQRHTWDRESDERLLQAIEKYGVNNWMAVARDVSPNATPTQCQSRYNKSLDPSIKRGAWTADEDERLKRAVSAIGTSWVRVAEYVPGRTNDQCNERWTAQLNAGSPKNVWTDDEDRRLMEMVNSMGRQWKAISEKLGNGKTGPSCRLRFNKLMKAPDNAAGSGLVVMSPAPGTASAASSMPAATPREMSVQSELPSTPTEGSTSQKGRFGPTKEQSTIPESEAGESNPATEKSLEKRRAKDAVAENEFQSSSKRRKPMPTGVGDPTEPISKKRPVARPKPRVNKASTALLEQTAIPEHILPTDGQTSTQPVAGNRPPPRRSARFTSGKTTGSNKP